MGLDPRFLFTGAKRVFDNRPMYAQVIVTDDCNLSCGYCDEYTPGAPLVALETLKKRIDRLDELGVLVYDFLGGEPLMHPGMAELVGHAKSKRRGSNLATIITNAFLLTQQNIRELNEAGLDFMQVSIDTVVPNALSQKSLKSVLPKLTLLADKARFKVEIQTVLCEESTACYEEFRRMLKDFPFAFGFSLQHERGGKIAIRGHKFLELLRKYGVFEGVNFYGHHLQQMLLGDFSQPWQCLAGFKFIYVNAKGYVQWCAQQRNYQYPLEKITLRELKANDHHKPCEAGCALGCVRMVSYTLGQPLKTLGASLSLVLQMRGEKRPPLGNAVSKQAA